MVTKLKKIVAVLLVSICIITLFDGVAAPVTVCAAAAVKDELNGHKLIAENNAYALYMNEEALSIIVYDKATGKFMESTPSYDDGKNNKTWQGAMRSAIVLNMIKGGIDTLQADIINDKVTKKVSYTDKGFTATLYWTKYKLGMTLEVELTDDGVIARIPDESIKEDGNDYYIGTISVYPYMGSSYMDDKDGYMFIP
ncbi:MAG: hypothetical protein J6B39_04120, partial [Lachnospiraceae bacterium]|nr:hypothetical protein [Lachnospiraceae bacterium]